MSKIIPEADQSVIKRPQLTTGIYLKDADAEIVKWIQLQLTEAGYLNADDNNSVDGIVGDKTLAALAAFKNDFQLEYPTAIGPSTIDVLEKAKEDDEDSDRPEVLPSSVNEDAGKKTGKTATLPIVGLVYENDMIVPGSHITWGEMTRGFSRLPMGTNDFGSPEQVVKNMVDLAKVFSKVRAKFGSPIAINSAYRPPNLSIGAAKSQHKFGRALDVRPLNGDYSKLLEAIKAVPEVKGIGLAGPGRGFWHMDIRPSANRINFPY